MRRSCRPATGAEATATAGRSSALLRNLAFRQSVRWRPSGRLVSTAPSGPRPSGRSSRHQASRTCSDMTPPRHLPGTAHDVSGRTFKAAWLSGFAIDHANLRPAHTDWLDRHLLPTIESACARNDEQVASGVPRRSPTRRRSWSFVNRLWQRRPPDDRHYPATSNAPLAQGLLISPLHTTISRRAWLSHSVILHADTLFRFRRRRRLWPLLRAGAGLSDGQELSRLCHSAAHGRRCDRRHCGRCGRSRRSALSA
jgi:hypothetical protein